MSTFTTSAHDKPIRAADATRAAEILARRLYGRRGVVSTVNVCLRSHDGLWCSWEAFVGKPHAGGGVHGRTVRLYRQL